MSAVRVELVFEGGYQGVQRRARGTIYFLPSEFLPFSDERYCAELTGLRAEPASDNGTTQAWSRSRARPWFGTRGERIRAQQVANELRARDHLVRDYNTVCFGYLALPVPEIRP